MHTQERFMGFVETPEAENVEMRKKCWTWKGAELFHMTPGRAPVRPRRASYEIYRGEVPKGQRVTSLCGNTKCVNPWHLSTE